MKIEPARKTVYLKMEGVKVEGLNIESMRTAIEYAEVLAVGEEVDNFKKGDKVFVKAWAVDMINHEGKEYRFVNVETNGILAKVS